MEFLDLLEVGMALLLRLEVAAVEENLSEPICINVVLYVFSYFGFGYEDIYVLRPFIKSDNCIMFSF